VLDALEDMLAQLGHEVLSTTHGEEAMEAMVRESESGSPIEAYILDLTIKGGVGGVETAKAILDEVPDACIIASSGYSNAPVMAQPQHYGFADTLQKPYDLKLLETVLSRNLPRG
jgi:two-component system, cell cycle sensor histidine kinase and response regulator CckA